MREILEKYTGFFGSAVRESEERRLSGGVSFGEV